MVPNGVEYPLDLLPVDSTTQLRCSGFLTPLIDVKAERLGFCFGVSAWRYQGLDYPRTVPSQRLLSQLAFLGKQKLNLTGKTHPRKNFFLLTVHAEKEVWSFFSSLWFCSSGK